MTPEEERLVLDNRRLVPAVLHALGGMRRYADRDGLIGAGNLALVQAALRYDPARGVPFGAFASIRIRGAMKDEARQGSFGTRRSHDDGIAVRHAAVALLQTLGHTPTEADIGTHLGWPADRVERALLDTEQTYLYSLDVFLTDPDLAGSGVEPAGPEMPEALYCDAETAAEVRAAIDRLPARHRAIVTAYYLHGRNQDDIAAEYGVSGCRVSQLLAAARGRMKRTLAGALHARAA
jgi:RNA polymerase sigma factor FliA